MSNSNLTGTDGTGRWYGNITLILNPELCTVKTCDLTLASFLYIPSLPGNAIYAAIFALYIVAQLFLGIKYKTWGYMAAMVLGLALEVFGYVARIMLNSDPFNNNDFLMYLVALTIAPALLSASVGCHFSLPRSLLTSFATRFTCVSPVSSSSTAKPSLASGLVHTPSSSAPATSFVSSYKLWEVPLHQGPTRRAPATLAKISC